MQAYGDITSSILKKIEMNGDLPESWLMTHRGFQPSLRNTGLQHSCFLETGVSILIECLLCS